MQAPEEHVGKTADHWERFWDATAGTHHEDAIRLPVLDSTWTSLLTDLEFQRDDFLAVELASGSGSVSKYLENTRQFTKATKVALDASTSALKKLRLGELPVSGNLERLPFAPESVDLLTSQFGIEYAGISSIEAALDCVASSGYFTFVLHIANGSIFDECGKNLAAVDRFLSSGFIDAASALLSALWSQAPPAEQQRLLKQFQSALAVVEPQLMVLPDGQGRDTALQTYNAIADMVEAPESYDQTSIGNWFQKTGAELQSYCVRMQQMRNSALTKDAFSTLLAAAKRKGFHISKQGVVRDDRPLTNAPELAFYVVGQQREGAI
jgi:hypothetical protein